MTKKLRLDKFLLKKKLVGSLDEASILINQRKIRIPNFNSKLLFEHTLISVNSDVRIINQRYVSRGGEKLHKFIIDSDIVIEKKICLDVGASTGGFTNALLNFGAKKVYCVDVGRSQLSSVIRNDDRVKFYENINARYDFNVECKKIDIVVVDVSFISVKMIVPQLKKFLKENSRLIVLIKPQFEARKDQVGNGGIIKNIYLIPKILDEVIKNLEKNDLTLLNLKKSELKGRKGNQEFFAMFKLA